MSDYCIDAVRYVNQELKAVRMGVAEPGRQGALQETPVSEAVARIEANHTVRALLAVDGRTREGPYVKVVPDGRGGKTLALDAAAGDCLELADLERF